MTTAKQEKQRLTLDASNRAVRTFVQGIYWDIVTAVLLALATWALDLFAGAEGWGDIQWTIMSFALVKTIAMSLAAFIMRRFVDGTRFPTPKPPNPPGEPNVDVLDSELTGWDGSVRPGDHGDPDAPV